MRLYLSIVLLLYAGTAVFAKTVSYQGRLTDQNNIPVSDNNYGLQFAIFAGESESDTLWTEFAWVTTEDGLFKHDLGTTTPLPDSILLLNELWLGISVQNEDLSDRTRLGWSLRSISSTFAESSEWSAYADTSEFARVAARADVATNADTAAVSLRADTAVILLGSSTGRILRQGTGSTTTVTSWDSVMNPIAFAPGEVGNYIQVSFVLSSSVQVNELNYQGGCAYRVMIGETGLESAVQTNNYVELNEVMIIGGAFRRFMERHNFTLYYEPSASEKANGFNLYIQLKILWSATTSSAGLVSYQVFGQ